MSNRLRKYPPRPRLEGPQMRVGTVVRFTDGPHFKGREMIVTEMSIDPVYPATLVMVDRAAYERAHRMNL